MTSINEGTPVSLIEAMASGKAVAATDAGGVKDLVGVSLEGPEDELGFTPLEAALPKAGRPPPLASCL